MSVWTDDQKEDLANLRSTIHEIMPSLDSTDVIELAKRLYLRGWHK